MEAVSLQKSLQKRMFVQPVLLVHRLCWCIALGPPAAAGSCHHHTLACFAFDGLASSLFSGCPPPLPPLQGLFQATSDCTEQQAAFQSERAEREEAAGVLRAQVQQLRAANRGSGGRALHGQVA